MTEQEWLQSAEPVRMVTYLRFERGAARTRSGRRKLRLFGCACCRRVRPLFPDERVWPAVDLAEQFADGKVSQDVVEVACRDAEPAPRDGEGDALRQARGNLYEAVRKVCGPTAGSPEIACSSVGIAIRWLKGFAPETAEQVVQAALLRDLFPIFDRQVRLDPSWLVWNGGTVVALAQTAQDDRAPTGELNSSHLGVLADALEDAGCSDETLLSHLRDPGPHARGCWVVDLLLGKG